MMPSCHLACVFIFSLMAFAGYASAGETEAEPSRGTPVLRVEPAVLDFGEVQAGSRVSSNVTLFNDGELPIRVRTKTGCGCTAARLSDPTIAPGESAEVAISLSVSGRKGQVSRKKVAFIVGGEPLLQLRVLATAKDMFVAEVTPQTGDGPRSLHVRVVGGNPLPGRLLYRHPANGLIPVDLRNGPATISLGRELDWGSTRRLELSYEPEVGGRQIVQISMKAKKRRASSRATSRVSVRNGAGLRRASSTEELLQVVPRRLAAELGFGGKGQVQMFVPGATEESKIELIGGGVTVTEAGRLVVEGGVRLTLSLSIDLSGTRIISSGEIGIYLDGKRAVVPVRMAISRRNGRSGDTGGEMASGSSDGADNSVNRRDDAVDQDGGSS